jgi:hypothetical protein
VAFFDEAEAAALAGESVAIRWGVLLHCASGDLALSDCIGSVDASAFGGPVFLGLGALGAVNDEIEIGSTAPTGAVKLTLSGLDERAFELMIDQQTEIWGRKARLYYLIFAGAPEWRLIAAKRRRTLIMDMMELEVAPGEKGAVAAINLTCQPITSGKFRAPWRMLTDVDQKNRYPGDRSCERVQALTQAQPMIFAPQ